MSTVKIPTLPDDIKNTPQSMYANGEAGPWYDTLDLNRTAMTFRRNCLTYTEFPGGMSDVDTNNADLVTETTFDGFDGGIAFATSGSNSTAYKRQNLQTLNWYSPVTISVFVKMDDGNAPVFGSSSVTNVLNDFVLVICGGATDPTTYVIEDYSSVYGTGVYRVSLTRTTEITNNTAHGILKYSGNSARGFKVTGYQLELGSLTPYQKITNFTTDFNNAFPDYTLWQDPTALTPVTNVGQTVGLWLDKSRNLERGVELCPNGDLHDGLTDWIETGTINSIEGGYLKVVSQTGNANRAEYSSSGFEIGKYYECIAVVKCSIGADTTIGSFTWGTLPQQAMRSKVDQSYRYIIKATSTSGLTRIYSSRGSAQGGLPGDTIYIKSLSIREIKGNHLDQSTSAARPVVSSRVNWQPDTRTRIINSSFTGGTITPGQPGVRGLNNAVRFQGPSTAVATNTTTALATTVTFRVKVKPGPTNSVAFSFVVRNSTTAVNFDTGTVNGTTGDITGTGWTRRSDVDGFWCYENIVSSGISIGDSLSFYYGGTNNWPTERDLYICEPEIFFGDVPANLPHQWVDSASGAYDTSRFPVYLYFDGVDDYLTTGQNVNLQTGSSTLAATVLPYKLIDGTIAEIGSDSTSTNGTFGLLTPPTASGLTGLRLGVRGTSYVVNDKPMTSPQWTTVVANSSIGDQSISVDYNGFNTVVRASLGTGVFSSQPLYVGGRAGSSLFFLGGLSSLAFNNRRWTSGQRSSLGQYASLCVQPRSNVSYTVLPGSKSASVLSKPLTDVFATKSGVWYDCNDFVKASKWRRNLATWTEFTNQASTDYMTMVGDASFSSLSGYDGAVAFTGNSVTTYVSKPISDTFMVDSRYTMSAIIYMDDLSGPPVIGTTTTTGDLSLVITNTICTSDLTVTDLGGGFYRISGGRIHSGAGTTFAIYKYPGQSARTFKTTAWQIELGSTPTEYQRFTDFNTEFFQAFPNYTLYQDAAGTTPVTQVEQPVGLVIDKSQGLIWDNFPVANGTFDSNITSWSAGSNASATWDPSGQMQITGGGSIGTSGNNWIRYAGGNSAFGPYDGLYEISFDATYVSGTGNLQCGRAYSVGAMITPTSNGGVKKRYTCRVQHATTGSASTGGITFGTTVAGDIWLIDNVTGRKLRGNHAYQLTTTPLARPTISQRANWILQSENLTDAVWTKSSVTVTSNAMLTPRGTASALLTTTAGSTPQFYQTIGKATARGAALVWLAAGTQSSAGISLYSSATHRVESCRVISGPGTASLNDRGSGTYMGQVTGLSQTEWTLVEIVTNNTGLNSTATLRVYFLTEDGSFNPTVGSSLKFGGAHYSPDGKADRYQYITDASHYDTESYPPTLMFDGVDDYLLTNSLDWTSYTDVTAFSSFLKYSDAAAQLVMETSANSGSNANSLMIASPSTNGGNNLLWCAHSSSAPGPQISRGSVDAPAKIILSAIGYTTENVSINSNFGTSTGTAPASSTLGNYPIYIGRRGGSTLPLNGGISSLVIVTDQLSTDERSNVMNYINYLGR